MYAIRSYYAARGRHPLLGETLGDLVPPLRQVLANAGSIAAAPEGKPAHELIRPREWQQATRAAIRAGLAIAAVGTVWSASGWRQGPIMLMTRITSYNVCYTKLLRGCSWR